MQCYSAHHEYIEPSEHGDYYLASEADAALAAKDARIAELEKAIRWALGEEGEFGSEPPPLAGKYRRAFWWRTELRARAKL